VTFLPETLEDLAPNLRPDDIAVEHMRNRRYRLRIDPAYRAQQRLRSQIGQSNSVAAQGKRNTKVSLPKFSWDKES
jgi:hypothetical protein